MISYNTQNTLKHVFWLLKSINNEFLPKVTSYALRASLVAQLVKNPPTVWETWIWSLGWEDPLEKGVDTHSSILAWRVPWTV